MANPPTLDQTAFDRSLPTSATNQTPPVHDNRIQEITSPIFENSLETNNPSHISRQISPRPHLSDHTGEQDAKIQQAKEAHRKKVAQYAKKRDLSFDLKKPIAFRKAFFNLLKSMNPSKAIETRLRKLADTMENALEGDPITAFDFKKSRNRTSFSITAEHLHHFPHIRCFIELALKAIQENDIELAQFIFDHLHGLEIEAYLIDQGNAQKTKDEFAVAARYYHAMTLMHPYDIYWYLEQAQMHAKLGEYDRSLAIYQEAKKFTSDAAIREYIEIQVVIKILNRGKSIKLDKVQGPKFLKTLFKIAEAYQENVATLPRCIVELISNMINQYAQIIDFSEEDSRKQWIELAHLILKITQSHTEEVQEIRRHFAGQLMRLIYLSPVPPNSSEKAKTDSLYALATCFYRFPEALCYYCFWCFDNSLLEDLIAFFESSTRELASMSCLEQYHLAKAMLAKNVEEEERQLRLSHQAKPEYWTASNLGLFLLRQRRAQDALSHLQTADNEAMRSNPRFLSLLWASQVLCGQQVAATETLQDLAFVDPDRIQSYYDFQRPYPTPSYSDVLEFVGITPSSDYATQKIKKAKIISDETREWIQKQTIRLENGYIGIPIHQIKAKRMPPDRQEYYRTKLQEKLSREGSLQLPVRNQDCWIGKHGSPDPRVDIEHYHAEGNAPLFQRFRFQEGSDTTYGGLWLPTGYRISPEVIQEAFEQWIRADCVYLVVLDPAHYADLDDVYVDIFGMDHSDKK